VRSSAANLDRNDPAVAVIKPFSNRSNPMPDLEQFFSRSFRPFYLATGAGTALIGLFAFVPGWATQHVAKLPFLIDYTIIIQHWGIMVGLMGLFMMGAAMFPAWRAPIGLYSILEKAFMVWLVLFNARQPFVAGFWLPFVMDLTVVAYTVGYFYYCGFDKPRRDQPARPA
jgi:hypothetical protein